VTRTNNFNALVDFTGIKFFQVLDHDGIKISFCRNIGFVRGSPGSRVADGIRFLCYGPLAELVYASIIKGTRAFVISHLQTRCDMGGHYFVEFVIEEIQYISGDDHEAGEKKRLDLIERGILHPNTSDELKINLNYELGDDYGLQDN